MKTTFLMALIISSAQAFAFDYPKTVAGTHSEDYGCVVSPGFLVDKATSNALENARKMCNSGQVQQIGSTRILESQRGSCWAGNPSHVIVAINFKCSISGDKSVRSDFKEPSCPRETFYCPIFRECVSRDTDCSW